MPNQIFPSSIDIYVSCFKAKRGSACAASLLAIYPDGRTARRDLSAILGTATINLSGLQAIRLGLLSVKPSQHNLLISITIDNHYATIMLHKTDAGEFKTKPSNNVDMVNELRKIFSEFGSIKVIYQKYTDGIGGECAAMAIAAAENQRYNDSGTYYGDGK